MEDFVTNLEGILFTRGPQICFKILDDKNGQFALVVSTGTLFVYKSFDDYRTYHPIGYYNNLHKRLTDVECPCIIITGQQSSESIFSAIICVDDEKMGTETE